jgi:hypothetical protein
MVIDAYLGIRVIAYVDASYAVDSDFKSHTGAVISLGYGPIFVKSTKQKLKTKSSTEAELVRFFYWHRGTMSRLWSLRRTTCLLSLCLLMVALPRRRLDSSLSRTEWIVVKFALCICLRRLLHVEEVIVIRLQDELFTLQIIISSFTL